MSARLALVAVLLAVPTLAHAGTGDDLLVEASAAAEELDFPAARALVTRALESGDLDPAGLARAYRMAGELAAAADDEAAAQAHFVRWILLEPEAALAEGESPKITAPFAAARVEVQNAGALTVEISARRADAQLVLTADANDPLGMIAGLRVTLPSGARIERRGLDLELPADPDAPIAVDVIIFDEHGNTISVRPVSSDPAVVATPVDTVRRERWPTPIRWPTWAVLGAVSGGAALYFSAQLREDKSDLAELNSTAPSHSADLALDVAARGERHALYANISIGAAAVFGVVTIITFLAEPRGVVEVAPAPGGGAASVRLAF